MNRCVRESLVRGRWSVQQAKVAAALAHCKTKAGPKVGVLGFCYGGHPACYASATDADVKVGVVFHPSMQLETFAFGGDTAKLMAQVGCPFLICPAGDDFKFWAEDSDFSKALKTSKAGSACVWKPFPDMKHGWSCRGDLGDAAVKRDVELALNEAKAFLAAHLK